MFSSLLIRFAELEHYTSLPVQPMQAGHCDVIINRPTIFMKLDAGVLNTFYSIYVQIYKVTNSVQRLLTNRSPAA